MHTKFFKETHVHVLGRLLLLLAVLFALPGGLAKGADNATAGRLDTSFGSNGQVVTDFAGSEDYASAVVAQPDGKILLAGYTFDNGRFVFALTRYTTNGALDDSFGTGGKVTTDLQSGDAYAYALALQPDGKLLVAGGVMVGAGYDFALARYLPTGQLDGTFGAGGVVTTSFGTADDTAYALALQPDGTFYAAGYATPGDHMVFALARYLPDGKLDSTFGQDGKLTTDPTGGDAGLHALALQPDGKLVAAGNARTLADLQDVAVARYNPDGTLDSAFNGGAVALTDFFHDDDFANGLALQPDGKLVVVGTAWSNMQTDLAILRYNPDGKLDPSFASTGQRILALSGPGNDLGNAVALQVDGEIVAAGVTQNNFALARFNPDGGLDASFGTQGAVTTPFHSADMLFGLAVQPDGSLIAAGRTYDGKQTDFALARYDTRLLGSASVDSAAPGSLGSTGLAAQFAPGLACASGSVSATRAVRHLAGLAESVPAVWQVSTSCAGSYDLSLTFSYRPQDLAAAGVDANRLAVYYSPDGGQATRLGGKVDAAAQTITVTGISAAEAGGYLTLAGAPAAVTQTTVNLYLPVTWLRH